jgi:hypothetical protein
MLLADDEIDFSAMTDADLAEDLRVTAAQLALYIEELGKRGYAAKLEGDRVSIERTGS